MFTNKKCFCPLVRLFLGMSCNLLPARGNVCKIFVFLFFPAKENLCKVLIFAFAGKRESVLSPCFLLLPGLSGWHKGWAGLKTKKAAFYKTAKAAFCKTAKAAFYKTAKAAFCKTALYFLIYGLFFCQVLIDGSCGSAAFAHCKDYCCGSQNNISSSPNR